MLKKVIRWIGIVVGVIVALIIVAAVIVYFRSEALVAQKHNVPDDVIPIPSDEAALARGKYLATAVSVCVDCHGDNFAGGIVADDPALGRIVAPNLTTGQGGVGSELSDAAFVKAIRYGVRHDGVSVKVMPSEDYQYLTDADLGAIIAYVKSMPPQDSDLPTTQLGPMGRLLLTLGQLPILIANSVNPDVDREPVEAGVNPSHGSYLADIAGCTGCHGPGLSGGMIPAGPPDWPPAANLTPSGDLSGWSEADFISTIRSGVTPAGKAINPLMPWPRYGAMTDDDLKALWSFISSVPAREAGTR